LKPGPYHDAFPITERVEADAGDGDASTGVSAGVAGCREAHPAPIAQTTITSPTRRHIIRTTAGFGAPDPRVPPRFLTGGL